jgi:hypothetical protein
VPSDTPNFRADNGTVAGRDGRSLSVADVARCYRVSKDKVRAWVRRGELAAVNVAAALSGRPQLRITAEALIAFEQQRSAGPPPKPPRRRRRTPQVDFYPD